MTGDFTDRVVQPLYNRFVRERLSRRLSHLNGVTTRRARLLDATDVHDDYEASIVEALESHVDPGHDVVIVGGGYGVSTVRAAEQAGENGSVTTYEASGEHVEIVEEAARINDVADVVDVEHAIVSSAISTYGDVDGATVLEPSELRECDVLELDCEGAERMILRDLESRPRVVIVETHSHLGSPERAVRDALDGYDVVDRTRENETCVVLTAIRKGDRGE